MIKLWKSYLFIFWLAGIESLFCREAAHKEWDILIFTQSWPITVCLQWKEKNEDHTCKFPPLKGKWTVHGIWPTRLGTHEPGYCNSSWKFDEEKIVPIEDELKLHWPNIQNGTKTYSLWEHEWEKHGTCAASLHQLDSEEKYFQQGIEWAKAYDLSNILSQTGINPSSGELTAQMIAESVKTVTKRDPFLECTRDPETGQEYLLEIRICFDKNLLLIDCDGITDAERGDNLLTNCPEGKPIFYPSKVPPTESWHLTALKFITFLQWFTM